MFGHRYFHQLDGKTYFKRSSSGPYYQIGLNEDLALRNLVSWQRRRMTLVIIVFAAALIPAALTFSTLLDLEAGPGLMAAALLVALGISPFAFVVLIHFSFQRKVREVLGNRHGEMDIGIGEKEARAPSDRRREGRLALLFFIGVTWLTLAAYMLALSPEELSFRKTVVWVLNLAAAGLLSFLGGHGLITLDRKRLGPAGKPNREFSGDAQGDRP